MKWNTGLVVLLMVIGAAALLFSSFFFQYPLFGWVITGVMLVVFLGAQERYRRALQELDKDDELLQSYRLQDKPELIGDGQDVIGRRISILQSLQEQGARPDAQTFSEVLSARESSRIGKSAGSTVLLLGLMGTFFGLMLAIADAGSSLETEKTSEILLMIQNIFSSMKGIFGTSLAGLLAAILLNISFSLVSSRQMAFMADVEEFSQFRLFPYFRPVQADSTAGALAALEKKLSGLGEEISQSLSAAAQKSADTLKESFQAGAKDLQQVMKDGQQEFLQAQGTKIGEWLEQSSAAQKDHAKELASSIDAFLAQSRSSQQEGFKQLSEDTRDSVKSLAETLEKLPAVQQEYLKDLQETQQAFMEGSKSQLETFYGKMSQYSDTLNTTLDEVSRSNFAKLQEEFQALSVLARESLESQSAVTKSLEQSMLRLTEGLQENLSGQSAKMGEFAESFADAGSLMKVNQAELQSSLEMFNAGVEQLLEKLGGGSESEGEMQFLEQLDASLTRFHERASEALVENAHQTQEILLEVLNRVNSMGMPATEGGDQ